MRTGLRSLCDRRHPVAAQSNNRKAKAMKGTITRIVALVALVFATGVQAQEGSQTISGSHLGTWKLVSFKYGTSEPFFRDFPESQQRIKLITETHFTWVQFDAVTMKVHGAAGGTYSLSGNTYTESIDFGLGMDTYSGAKHAFTIRVEGDKFFLSGSLADGLMIEEIWQRVKGEREQ
jgi:hypothetical protein